MISIEGRLAQLREDGYHRLRRRAPTDAAAALAPGLRRRRPAPGWSGLPGQRLTNSARSRSCRLIAAPLLRGLRVNTSLGLGAAACASQARLCKLDELPGLRRWQVTSRPRSVEGHLRQLDCR